jgi:hypothetical protein
MLEGISPFTGNGIFCTSQSLYKEIEMHLKKLVLASSALFFNGASIAQESGVIDFGGFKLIPAIDITHALDDNITRLQTAKVDSWKRILSPRATLVNNFGLNTLQFDYRLERGDFFSSDQDNFTDHFLSALLDYEFNSRHRAKTSFEYEDGHDDRGTSFSTGSTDVLATPDIYNKFSGGIEYSYGALTADSRIDISYNYNDVDYDGSDDLFLIRDRENSTLAAIYSYQIAPVTEITVDYSRTDVSYDFFAAGNDTLDSTNSSLLVGVKWESTAATSGFAKIGYQEKDFDSAQREKFSDIDWAIGVNWQPIERTTIEFSTQSDTNETNGEGNFISQTSYNAIWSHQWLERVSSSLSFSLINDVYEKSVNSREDDLTQLNMTLNYQLKRWISLNLNYLYDERESSVNTISYDRNLFSLSVNVTL